MKNIVKFKDYVFEEPFREYYLKYYGHNFIVDHFHPDDEEKEHVWLKCITDPSLIVDGYVHYHDLEYI